MVVIISVQNVGRYLCIQNNKKMLISMQVELTTRMYYTNECRRGQ